ncbi:MAG: hypothetical protein ABIR80_15910 [Opitutaceae bacterium]
MDRRAPLCRARDDKTLLMPLLDKLERTFGRFAIPNLSLYLVIGQVFVLLTGMLQLVDVQKLAYAPALVTQAHEWWRIFSFLFVVPIPAPDQLFTIMFFAFGWYLFYLMGSALEAHWGAFRFNAFLFLTYVLTVGFSFVTPNAWVTNTFILGSVFIAFAYLNPDFELTLFFILPVKIKWLALLAVVLGAYRFVVSGLPIRLQTAAAVISFVVFFGGDILRGGRQLQRTRMRRVEKDAEQEEPRHRCHVCGKTDRSNPELDFRYCSKCAGDQCYCPEHIQNHAHVVAADEAQPR